MASQMQTSPSRIAGKSLNAAMSIKIRAAPMGTTICK